MLAGVAVAAYGFELVNFNLSFDEELHAALTGAAGEWIAEGRWGMYALNALLLPYTVVPVVPLLTALVVQAAAILVVLRLWGVTSRLDQAVAGSLWLAFPGAAILYSFSTVNFGIGIGWAGLAASLLLHARAGGRRRLLAAVPGALAVAIHQAFLPALAAVYLVWLLAGWVRGGAEDRAEVGRAGRVLVLAAAGYAGVQAAVMAITGIAPSEYLALLFDPGPLRAGALRALGDLGTWLPAIYSGSASVYGVEVRAVGGLVLLSLLGLAAGGRRAGWPARRRLLVAGAVLVLLALPVLARPLIRLWAVRWLLAAPVALAGVVALGLAGSRRLRAVTVALAGLCVFQFVVSANRHLGAGHLALAADRLLASRVIERIERAAGGPVGPAGVRHLEVIGYHERPASPLTPKLETIGFSFFELQGGSAARILLFLETLGWAALTPLPQERRADMVGVAGGMPVWPGPGSVRVVGDTVLLKFGDYSFSQRAAICRGLRRDPGRPRPPWCR